MTDDETAPPVAPQIRPLGPLIAARDLEIWHSALEARAVAERNLKRVRGWARRAYQKERARGHAEGVRAGAEEMAQLVAQAASEVARRKAVLEQELSALVMDIVTDLLGDCRSRRDVGEDGSSHDFAQIWRAETVPSCVPHGC
ncbi:flagellar biosynthesis/type III secretory pathway protein FliH [Bradyrhizobium sp. GM22.5]